MAEYENKLKSAANALARRQLGLESKKDEVQKDERLPEIFAQFEKAFLDTLTDSFKEVCAIMKQVHGLKDLSDDTLLMIANKINDRAISGDLIFVKDLSQDKEIAAIVETASEKQRNIDSQNAEIDGIDEQKTAENSLLKEYTVLFTIKGEDGNDIVFVEPIDPQYAYHSKDEMDEDVEIADMVDKMEDLSKKVASGEITPEEYLSGITSIMDSSEHKVGADALMQSFYNLAISEENKHVLESEAVKKAFGVLGEARKPENGFREDGFTVDTDLKTYSALVELSKEGLDVSEYITYMKDYNQHVTKYVDENPNFVKDAENVLGVESGQILVIENSGRDASIDEIYEAMDNLVEKISEIKKNHGIIYKTDNKQQYDDNSYQRENSIYSGSIKPINDQEVQDSKKVFEDMVVQPENTATSLENKKKENFRKMMMTMSKAKGIGHTLQFAHNSMMTKSPAEQQMLMEVISDFVQDKSIMTNADVKDVDVMKGIVKNSIEVQNESKDSNMVGYIQAFSDSIKEYSSREIGENVLDNSVQTIKEDDGGPEL